MGMATPKHSNQEINRAGSVLRSTDASSAEKMAALDVINNWRACHYYPINTFQANLRRHLNIIDLSALVGQRLKRVSSVESKLKRFKSMDLARMQDIGGLRAIVQDIATVRQLEERYEKSRFDHKLVRKDDYIQNNI